MYTYEPFGCTPAEERLPYNRPDLWGRGGAFARAHAHARIIYHNIILWTSLNEAHIRYGVASRVAADAQERVPPAWPYASHQQTRDGRGEAGGPRSRVAVRVPPAGRVGVFAITSFVNRGGKFNI